MKTSITTTLLSIGLFSMMLSAQSDSTGLPGDNFSLEGALELFKNAKSPEDFEKSLNTEENYVNNLDLNQDGEIDYIRVEDHQDGDVHAMVLQVPVNENETQDIAVIEIEKTGDETAILQIIGDEDIYGENIIVEPFEEESNSNRGGPDLEGDEVIRLVVNVYLWPSVRFIYKPGYVVWRSPWYWLHYPAWWRPWRPHPWRWYHPRRVHYHVGFHRVTVHRVERAHRIYVPRRNSSTVVRVNNRIHIDNYRSERGVVRKASLSTSTRTVTATGPRGNKVTATKSTTTVRGAGNNAAAKKSTTTVQADGPNKSVKASRTSKAAAARGSGKAGAVQKKDTKAKVKGSKGSKATRTKTTKVAGKKGNTKVKAGKKTKVKKKKKNG